MIGDVSWDIPSPTSAGSLPLGNGDLAANVWVEPSGDLVFYLSKSDAWDHLCRLIKLGRVRVRLNPPLIPDGAAFTTQLDLATASILITTRTATNNVSLHVWVDAHRPRVVVQIESTLPVAISVSFDPWRTTRRTLTGPETGSAYGVTEGPDPLIAEPDILVDTSDDVVIWYQRNESSIWAPTLDHQSLGEFKSTSSDPLLHRTFGGLLSGADFKRVDERTLHNTKPVTTAALTVDALTSQTTTTAEWITALRSRAASHHSLSMIDAWRDHTAYWRDFWERSHIVVTARGPDWGGADEVTAAYARQRYLVGCCGRGAYPIKFNGALFTADWGAIDGQPYDADYRRWGGGYWFQNTRLAYWPMLAAGDADLLAPLTRMYRVALPLAEHRTHRWFGHEGAFFPETGYFWGTHVNDNYGWKRDDLPPGEIVNRYIGRHYNGALELLALLLSAHSHTHDQALLEHDLLPLARSILRFFARHYSPDSTGLLRFTPAQALETWWECVNPTPDVAGLRHVLTTLLALSADTILATDRAEWTALLAIVPPLSLGQNDGHTYVRAAEQHELVPRNLENAELYAVFPFPLYGLGRPDLATGRWTFAKRPFQDTGGWRQDAVHAALLGLTETAAFYVQKNATSPSAARYRGFFGPNYDWLPDVDHSSVTQLALQTMLLQSVGEKIYLFPAWPDERWDVSFRLHAPGQTIIEAELKAGRLTRLVVTPESRRRDVVMLLGVNKETLS